MIIMNKENNIRGNLDYRSRMLIKDAKNSKQTFSNNKKRGNSLDPSKEKRIDIEEKPQITNLITQIQKKQPLTPNHQTNL